MKASGPYWPLKSMILNIGSGYVPGHLELHKSNSAVSCKAMNCPEGLHRANIHTGLTNIPKSHPSRQKDQHKSRTKDGKNLLLDVWVKVKQMSQGDTRVKKSSKNCLTVQLPTALAHQGSKHDLGVTEQKLSPTTTIFDITVSF